MTATKQSSEPTCKENNIVIGVGGILQVVSDPLLSRSGWWANLIEDDESLKRGLIITPYANPISDVT